MKKVPPTPAARVDGTTSAVILDWCGPFAERVMSRLHEYDDEWPRMSQPGCVVPLRTRKPKVNGCKGRRHLDADR